MILYIKNNYKTALVTDLSISAVKAKVIYLKRKCKIYCFGRLNILLKYLE